MLNTYYLLAPLFFKYRVLIRLLNNHFSTEAADGLTVELAPPYSCLHSLLVRLSCFLYFLCVFSAHSFIFAVAFYLLCGTQPNTRCAYRASMVNNLTILFCHPRAHAPLTGQINFNTFMGVKLTRIENRSIFHWLENSSIFSLFQLLQ